MKCEECESSLRRKLFLECVACGMFPVDCTCEKDLGYTPNRLVNCKKCDRRNIKEIDTTENGWRRKKV